MPDVTQALAPPAYWQAFEEVTASVAGVVFSDLTPQRVGRPGQAQDGLDVLARAPGGRRIGLQCKRRDDRDANGDVLAGGPVTIAMVRKAVAEVDKGGFAVDQFILATTAKTDTPLQTAVERLRTQRRRQGKSDVLVWSWGDYEAVINRNDGLRQAYYRAVPQGLTDPERDAHLLAAFAEAFNRPALGDALSCEHPGDFRKALSDVRMALATGVIRDRDGHVIRQAAGGLRTLADPAARRGMEAVLAGLDDFREDWVRAERDGKVSQQPHMFIFHDGEVQDEFEGRRRRVVEALNAVLAAHGLDALRVR